MAVILYQIEDQDGVPADAHRLFNPVFKTANICITVKNFANIGVSGVTISFQSNPFGTDDDNDTSWQQIKWEDGTNLIMTSDDTAVLPSSGQFIRAVLNKAIPLPSPLRIFLK
jgi:hypothetical protein